MKLSNHCLNYPAETMVFAVFLAVLNLPGMSASVALFPSALHPGEFWRWITFPWAHISLYHLLLDATAFLCLYNQLRCGFVQRLQHLVLCIFFSGLAPVLTDARIETIGLRGLSGVAHGLMIVAAVEAISNGPNGAKGERVFGILILAFTVGKALLEQGSGAVLFANYHLGNVGLPVPSCHAGGALGALTSVLITACWNGWRGPELRTGSKLGHQIIQTAR